MAAVIINAFISIVVLGFNIFLISYPLYWAWRYKALKTWGDVARVYFFLLIPYTIFQGWIFFFILDPLLGYLLRRASLLLREDQFGLGPGFVVYYSLLYFLIVAGISPFIVTKLKYGYFPNWSVAIATLVSIFLAGLIIAGIIAWIFFIAGPIAVRRWI